MDIIPSGWRKLLYQWNSFSLREIEWFCQIFCQINASTRYFSCFFWGVKTWRILKMHPIIVKDPGSVISVKYFYLSNKKVLLRERKRHTNHSVSSTSYVVLSRGEGYLPWWGGRYPLPHPVEHIFTQNVCFIFILCHFTICWNNNFTSTIPLRKCLPLRAYLSFGKIPASICQVILINLPINSKRLPSGLKTAE